MIVKNIDDLPEIEEPGELKFFIEQNLGLETITAWIIDGEVAYENDFSKTWRNPFSWVFIPMDGPIISLYRIDNICFDESENITDITFETLVAEDGKVIYND